MLVLFTAIFPSPLLSLPCVVPNVVFHSVPKVVEEDKREVECSSDLAWELVTGSSDGCNFT